MDDHTGKKKKDSMGFQKVSKVQRKQGRKIMIGKGK